MQAGQMWCQAVTTNVPGPRVPLYVLGKRMVSATAYVPIAGGTRCSIGIFSYLNTMTFGINADFDGYPDVDVLSGGIRRGIEELLTLAAKKTATDKTAADSTAGSDAASTAEPTAATKPAARPAKKTTTAAAR
jgi:diacylglycerol O-acyltransferase / wax synthase